MILEDGIPIGEPNQPLKICSETALVNLGASTLETQMDAIIRFLPTPRLLFEAEIPPHFGFDLADAVEVRFPNLGLVASCDILQAAVFSTEPSKFRCLPKENVHTGKADTPTSKIAFGVPNFPEFIGLGTVQPIPGGGCRREYRIDLEFGAWKATLWNTEDAAKRKEVLRENGGYAVTAIGEMRRSDGATFTLSEAETGLEALRVFLSFACGRWTGSMLPTGLDNSGQQCWQRWTPPIIDEGISVFTWFDIRHSECLSAVIPGFFARWTEPDWHDSISRAIYWFVRANSNAAGADGSLILSQAALESLSWTYLGASANPLTPKSVKNLRAAERLRKLLADLKIPAAVPSGLQELAKAVAERSWIDGPGAIAAIRNNLVHPEKHGNIGPIAECWLLSQQYLELCLLRLFNYVGQYGNRTKLGRWVGQVENVPWAAGCGGPSAPPEGRQP